MSHPPSQKPMPEDFEELDFTIEQEEWNEYELNDGVTIKGRAFLAKIIRNPYNPKDMSFNFSIPVWAVYAPPALRGTPDKRNRMEIQANHSASPKYEVHINKSHEPWNIYRILKTGQKLKIKLTIQEINRLTDKYDANGMPSYNVPHGIAVSITGNQPETGQ